MALCCAVALAAVAGCGGDRPVLASGPIPTDAAATPSITGLAPPGETALEVTGVVATGLASPWSIAFLPDADALVSERDTGSIVLVGHDGTVTPVGEVPDVVYAAQSGLLGLAVSPAFDSDHLVYAYLTTESDSRIVRMTYEDGRLGVPEVVLDGIQTSTSNNGGRIKFGSDGMLYVGTGDAGDPSRAQDLNSLNGKILRMTPDGGIPRGNPFGTLVWSYGHCNVQGFGWAADGTMWADELGADAVDELNRIEPGGNYGWPVVEGQTASEGMIEPVAQWPSGQASPSGLAVVDNSVFMAALRGQSLWHIPMTGSDSSLEPVPYFTGVYGRLRDVVEAPDGALWVLTSNTDGRGAPHLGDDHILRVQRPS